MKTPLKSTLTALSLIIFAAFAISGCANSGGSSGTGTHTMMYPKAGTVMADQSMASGHR